LNNPLIYTDPSGEFWQYLVAAAFFYLKSAHDNRDQDTGKWDWNPFDKGSTFVAGVKTDTEFKEVTGYVAGGSGYYIPAFSYSSQNGPGIGYYSPQGSSFTYPGANHNRASEVVLREMNEVRQAYGSAWQNQSFDENGLLPPVDLKFPITSPYKKDNRIIPELGLNRPHLAIDIGTPIGTPVLSPWSGTVTMAQDTKYGLSVIVKHDYFYADNFIQTGYAHLSKINITKGLQINRGDTIGYTGIWGTGPHLHFTLRFGEKKVNPTILFPYK
jgi:murein DD-endopeptidase MepM/ murein hydrolase activator NlpD